MNKHKDEQVSPSPADTANSSSVPTGKRRHWKRRIFVYSLVSLLAVGGISDLYLETQGLPEWAVARIVQNIRRKGIDADIGSIRVGLINGIVAEEVLIKDAEQPTWELLYAESIRCNLDWVLDQSSPLRLTGMGITGGRIKIPLFPETGMEGQNDFLSIDKIEAQLRRDKKAMHLEYLSGELAGTVLRVSGTMLIPAIPLPPAAPLETGIETHRGTVVHIIQKIPWETRVKILELVRKVENENSSSKPASCHASIEYDPGNDPGLTIAVKIDIPSLSYRQIPLSNISGKLFLAGRILKLDQLRMQVAPDEYLLVAGVFNHSDETISGEISGRAGLPVILPLVGIEEPQSALLRISTGEPFEFSAKMDKLSFSAKLPSGAVQLDIDSLPLAGIDVKKLKIQVQFPHNEDESIRLSHLAGEFSDNEKFSADGQYDPASGKFSGSLEGKVSGSVLNVVSSRLWDIEDLPFSFGQAPVKFSGKLRSYLPGEKEIDGSFSLNIPQFKLKDTEFSQIRSDIDFNEKSVHIQNARAEAPGKVGISGNFTWYPGSRFLNGKYQCVGAPMFLPGLLPEKDRKFMNWLFSRFSWTDDPEDVQVHGQITMQQREDPFVFISSNIIARDFSYGGVEFEHGAALLIFDSQPLLVIPTILLVRPEGKVKISLVYDQRQQIQPDVPADFMEASEKARKELIVQLDSAITGEALLECLYPKWDPVRAGLDLNQPFPVQGWVYINELDPETDRIQLQTDDAKCAWHGLPITQLKTEIKLENNVFRIKDAKGKLCDGDLDLNYMINFNGDDGHIRAEIKDAHFGQLIKNLFGSGDGNDPGILTSSFEADLKQNKEAWPDMHGVGTIAIRDAELWKIPLLVQLDQLLNEMFIAKHDWGKISRMDADLKFIGDRIHSDNIKTDGSVIALSAKGDFFLRSNDFDYTIRARILKETLPFDMLNKLLDPVLWLFELRVHRQKGKIKWENISGVRNLLNLPLKPLKTDYPVFHQEFWRMDLLD